MSQGEDRAHEGDAGGGSRPRRAFRRWLGGRLGGAAAAVALLVSIGGMGVATGGPAGAASNAPIKVAFLWPQTGPAALPGRNNNVQLAVDQLNAGGGIDGHQVEWSAFDTGTSSQQAVTAVQQAIAYEPTVMVGLVVAGQVQATAQAIKASGIPLIEGADGPAATSTLVRVPNIYTVVPVTYMAVEASTQYLYSKYHPKTVGIFHTQDIASNEDAAMAESFLRKDGVKHFIVEKAPDTATDTSDRALAMKSANVDMLYGSPQVTYRVLNDLYHDGSRAPIIGDQGFDDIVGAGLDGVAALKNTVYTTYCNPDVLTTPAARSYVSAYQSAYPGSATTVLSNPFVYDAVQIAARAIEKDGGNLSGSAIEKALNDMNYQGACGTYKTDKNHDMMHQVSLISVKNGLDHLTLAKTENEGPATVGELKKAAAGSPG